MRGLGLGLGLSVKSAAAAAVWTPADVSGLKLWLDADDANGYSDTDSVSQWNDLSGEDNHATQSTGSAQPTFLANQQNSLPGIDFDGGDYLSIAGIVASMSGADQPATVIAVINRDNTNLEALIGWSNSGDANPYWFIAPRADLRLYMRDDAPTSVTPTGGTMPSAGTAVMVTVHTTGTLANAWINETQAITDTAADIGTMTLDECTLGAYGGGDLGVYDGLVYEFLFYDETISDADRALIWTYLNDKWAVY